MTGLRLALLSVFSARIAFAAADINSNNTVDFALGCYDAVGINKDNLKDTAGNVPFNCTAGTPLPTHWSATVLPDPNCNSTCNLDTWDVAHPTAPKWPDGSTRLTDPPTTIQFPGSCDYPAWLSNKCYGHSYVQRLRTGDPKVTAVLLCRHKTVWEATNTNFDDVAIIIHNHLRTNGKTCFFQSRLGNANIDGTQIPPPHDAADAAAANPVWKTPPQVATYKCMSCHDNGSYMTSRWIDQAGVVPDDHNKGRRYVAPGAAFAGWLAPQFVTVSGAGIDFEKYPDASGCTSCHRISIRRDELDSAGDPQLGSCSRWIDYSTGGGRGPLLNLPTMTSNYGKLWAQARWMPPDHGLSGAKWSAVYRKHVEKLLACCANPALGDGCKDHPVAAAPIAPAPGPTGATATASVGAPARQTTTVVGPSPGSVPLATSVLIAQQGELVTLSWSASSVSDCSIGVTMPEGVEFSDASVTLPPSSAVIEAVGTGSNWDTAEGSVSFGPVTTPGDYVLDVSCDGPLATATSGEYVSPDSFIARVDVRLEGGPLPSGTATKCEDKLLQATAKLMGDTVKKCHRKRAKGTLVDAAAEGVCEDEARAKFDLKAVGLADCPDCVSANLDSIKAEVEAFLDDGNADIFCDGTIPFGGEDGGFIPPTQFFKCEDGLAKASSKLTKGLIKCYRELGKGKLPDDVALDACKAAAKDKFDEKVATLSGCPPCADFGTVRDNVEGFLDSRIDLAFCGVSGGP